MNPNPHHVMNPTDYAKPAVTTLPVGALVDYAPAEKEEVVEVPQEPDSEPESPDQDEVLDDETDDQTGDDTPPENVQQEDI